ncbi:NAD(P)/FAD-dependent oxidoreductase [Mycolicibacterium sp. CR10]|uniref:NAD(P)/FAD-dependent oxidoreductase n=1 Tax=Mycolicibacterium sp. CR10 TaxID=2562314 RepID=UPI0010C048ED|nr:NAD(P)/FAD-dependent oxidoreductase [Mycolicibacterium sp. CR10]
MDMEWECLVVGGGAAGLSAALVLGRARRRTLVVDAGQQSNLSAHGIGGLLGHDGRPPSDLYELGRKELQQYPSVEVHHGEVLTAQRRAGGFDVRLSDGTDVRARRVLLAMGMEYRPPDLPGLEAIWGSSVFHCPFCHGWEVRDQTLAVLADGERAVHMAKLLHGWSDDVVLLTGGGDLDVAQRACLSAGQVPVDDREVTGLESEDGELTAVVFADGSRLPRRGLLVSTTLHQRTDLAAQFGVNFVAPGPVSAEAVEIDTFYRTSVPAVFAAGDVCAQMPQIAAAIAAGSGAAISMVQSLMEEE